MIETMHARGWKFCRLNGKIPIDKDWPALNLSQAEIEAHTGNIGVITGAVSGIAVLDIDEGADVSALEIPRTVSARTGGGGTHYYFSVPDSRIIKNSVGKIGKHIDVRGERGFVVFPGSTHPETGARYEWIESPDVCALATAPEWMYAVAPPVKPKTTPRAASVSNGSAYATAALNRECEIMRGCSEGQRNDQAYMSALKLGGFVSSGALDAGTIESELQAAAESTGLPARETATAIRSGLANGVKNPRTIPPRTTAPAIRTAPSAGATTSGPRDVLIPGAHVDDDGVYFEVGNGEFQRAVQAALPPGTVYRRAGIPCRLAGDPGEMTTRDISAARYRGLIDDHMRLCRWHEDALQYRNATLSDAQLVLADADENPIIRDLRMLVNYPVFVADPTGEHKAVMIKPGWNECGIYYDEPPDLVGIEPMYEPQCRHEILDELLCDFCWLARPDMENLIGAMITILMEPFIDGARPLFLITSPIPRSGKSKLAEDVIGLIIRGKRTPSLSMASTDEEMQKRIMSLLLQHETIVHLDNLPPKIDLSSLASLLTSKHYSSRLLGASRMVSMPNHLTIIGTGNNVATTTEIAKRTIPIQLAPKTSDPEKRTDFNNPDLAGYIKKNRRIILAALLGMCGNWAEAKRLAQLDAKAPILGGFEEWSRCVWPIMRNSGYSKFASNLEAWRESRDDEGSELRALFDAWWEDYMDCEITTAQILEIVNRHELLPKIRRGVFDGRAVALGILLSRYADAKIGKYQLGIKKTNSGKKYTLRTIS